MRSTEPDTGRVLEQVEALRQASGLFSSGDTILVAVSGGADSMCLLHLLSANRNRWGIRVEAAHYNHHLRGEEARRDQDFVSDWCQAHHIPLHCGEGAVSLEARRRGQGIEETARQMRYDFLVQTAERRGGALLATAHNADDNGETLLMHLVRGSGLTGLTGISPRRGNLIRPLLWVTRQEIEAYDRQHHIPYVEDTTNQDIRYRRNFLRHQVMPLLRQLNPSLAQSIRRTTESLSEDARLLDGLAEQAMVGLTVDRERRRATLPRQAVADSPRPIQVRVVERLAQAAAPQLNLTQAQRQAVVDLALSQAPSGRVDLSGGFVARRSYELLTVEERGPNEALLPQTLDLPGELRWGQETLSITLVRYDGRAQRCDDFCVARRIGEQVQVRPRQTGDRLAPIGRPSKTLKKWMIDEKIPKDRRETLPVLVWGETIGGVVGIGVETGCHPRIGEEAWRCRWI